MQPGKLLRQLAVKSTVWLIIMGGALFGGAGDIVWPQGWAFLILFALGSLGFGMWLIKRNPVLLQARLDPLNAKGQPLWDKLFMVVFICLWLVWLAVMGADAVRFHWSHMPVWLNLLGGLVTISGYVLTTRVLSVNSFASPTIRVQPERAQTVVDSGAYAWVRHPMYAMMPIVLAGMPLLLGSWWGLLAVPVTLAALLPRAVMEENLLRRDLPGYADYMTRVRYRIIPYIW